MRCLLLSLIVAVILLGLATSQHAQDTTPPKSVAQPSPSPRDEQDPIKVFTEEVQLPVVAFDDNGRFDPTLEVKDLIVFEDGVQQELTSLRRIPASIVLLLATGGDMNPAMRLSTTRDTALRLVASLKGGDELAVLSFSNRVDVLQPWTTDEEQVDHVLKTKLQSASGARLAKALGAAAAYFVTQPIGNRHIVLITDGVELPISRANYEEAMKALALSGDAQSKAEWDAAVKRLLASQASVHIISYGELGRLALNGKLKKYRGSNSPPGSVLASGIQNAGKDPTMPPGTYRGMGSDPSFGAGINFDPLMRRLRKAYEKVLKTSDQRLSTLADETGARIIKPTSMLEMIDRGGQVAREIGAQYVVTYVPKRPLAGAKPGEYRRVQIAPRRSGLTVRSRRGYIATP